ncbi:tRNA-guanine transglycosylase [Xylariaceae sp. FL0255]|nr:tRNA-guanine transglycosylase [Xylariaceae sp. FL0255]
MVTPERDGRALFKIVKSVVGDGSGARVGVLSFPKRRPIETPNFLGLTARGAVPHITPDNVIKRTELGGVYMALEDFIETTRKKKVPAIYEMKSEDVEPLHAYTATPSHVFTVLAARRHPAIASPLGNTKESVSVFTSTGFQNLSNEDYRQAVNRLKPDVVIPLADLPYGLPNPDPAAPKSKTAISSKRQLRMIGRTEDWISQVFEAGTKSTGEGGPTVASPAAVFAPILPVPYPTQWEYLSVLEHDHSSNLSGLAVYDVDLLPDLPNHVSLMPLPRLSLSHTSTPQEILRQVQLGIDVFTVSFLNSMSDAGIALSFSFPPPPPADASEGIKELGINMWDPTHEIAVQPLVSGCTCYACTKHHRAFLHHLLGAKEMLGWTLLQIHNYHIVHNFFAGIRASLSSSLEKFEEDYRNFERIYDSELPTGTGTRPRARGYNFKSRGGDDRINKPAWEKYETGSDPALAGEKAGLAVTGVAAQGSETPLVPEGDAMELDKKGFAKIAK